MGTEADDRAVARQRDRDERARRYQAAAAPILVALEAAGLDTGEFGTFTTLYRTTFDYARAAPILIEWLPRIDEPSVVEAIARSLTGERAARGEGPRRLMVAFRRMSDEYPDRTVAWAIGNALSTLTGPADADGVIELLCDRRYGTARQMLCDALTRTHDPRATEIMIDLIDDDDINGHAILALRRLGNWKVIPDTPRALPRLERVLERSTSGILAKKQARKALEVIARSP